MEKAQEILSQALETVNMTPSFTKIKTVKFGDDEIYYVGNMELLSSTLIAMMQDHPSNSAQLLSKLCLEQIRERKASLITSGDIPLAVKMVKEGGNVVLLLSCGIRKANLTALMPGIRAGNVLVLSLSVIDPSDSDSVVTTTRLLAALCYCGFVVECQGGIWHSKKLEWNNQVMQKCEMLHEYGKTIFIAPWRKGHPPQHLVIKHEYSAVDLPDAEDPANVFSFIPQPIEDLE